MLDFTLLFFLILIEYFYPIFIFNLFVSIFYTFSPS